MTIFAAIITSRRSSRRAFVTIRMSLLLLLLLIVVLLASLPAVVVANSNKKLVLFAGPHKAASGSVESFFYNHASGYEGTTIAEGLEGWLWPKVTQDLWVNNAIPMDKPSIFNALVTQADNTTAQIILKQAIRDAWDTAEHGIIIGTPEFDRVGTTPYTGRSGIKAMRGILEELQIDDPQDVTVVLNYRAPRRDQWISIWKHVEGNVNYHKFLCKGDHKELIELLDTAMNPLKLAQLYRKESWNVVLMDMSGVDALEKDISHAIACNVLENTNCEEDFVVPVMQTYNENYGGDKHLASLGDKEQQDLDQLFRERDCYYEPLLRDDEGFQVFYRDTLWQGCLRPEESEEEEKTQKELYQHLSDPELLLDALKAQKGCAKNGSHMKNVLVSNNYTSMVVSTIHTKENQNGPSTEEDLFTPDEEFLAPGEEALLARDAKNRDSPWMTAFLVLIAGGFGMYQLHLIKRHGRGLRRDHQLAGGEQEMEDLSLKYRPNDLSLDTAPPGIQNDGDII
jgi:hypothetical protein